MPDPQINPPDASQSPAAQQWQQKQQPDQSKFRLSGLIGAMSPGPQSRGFPNLGGGAAYAFSPQQREMFGNTQDTGVQQSRSGLMQSSALNDYLRAHYDDPAAMNPDHLLAVAHAHGAGSAAALAQTQAQAAERTNTGEAGAEAASRAGGVDPYLASLRSGLAKQGGEAASAVAGGKEAGLKAGESAKFMGDKGVMPGTSLAREELANRKDIAGMQAGSEAARLAEEHAEFDPKMKADLLHAFGGYGGLLPLMYDEKGSVKPEFMRMMQSLVGGISGNPSSDTGPGSPDTSSIESVIEGRMRAGKAAPSGGAAQRPGMSSLVQPSVGQAMATYQGGEGDPTRKTNYTGPLAPDTSVLRNMPFPGGGKFDPAHQQMWQMLKGLKPEDVNKAKQMIQALQLSGGR